MHGCSDSGIRLRLPNKLAAFRHVNAVALVRALQDENVILAERLHSVEIRDHSQRYPPLEISLRLKECVLLEVRVGEVM